jgi:hypothetical protein
MARVVRRPIDQHSILQPPSAVVSAYRLSEIVPSIFDGTSHTAGAGDVFGAKLPDAPTPDRPRRITRMAGFGETAAEAEARAYFTTMGMAIDAQKAAIAKARAERDAALPKPSPSPDPNLNKDVVLPPASKPSFLSQNALLLSGVGLLAVGGVVAWKMGVFKKKAAAWL